MADAIAIENLEFRYRNGPAILGIKSLKVAAKSRTFLYGPSGSGKTTLLGIITGILDYQMGSVKVLGQELKTLSGRHRDRFRGAKLGYIFQMFNLVPYLSVRDNIILPCQMIPERRQRVNELNESCQVLARHLEIEELLEKPVTELSVGQQQRVAAARALIGAPPLIVADEPTSALDWDRREAFLNLLFREAERCGSTVLFVSHDQSLKGMFDTQIALSQFNQGAHP